MTDIADETTEDEYNPEMRVYHGPDGYLVIAIGRVAHSMHPAAALNLARMIKDVVDD
jgi:hypothetical protein